MVDKNMKKYMYNDNDVNYCIMSKLRQHFIKLGNYVMKWVFVVIEGKQLDLCKGNIIFCYVDCFCLQEKRKMKEKYLAFPILR